MKGNGLYKISPELICSSDKDETKYLSGLQEKVTVKVPILFASSAISSFELKSHIVKRSDHKNRLIRDIGHYQQEAIF